VGGVWLYLSLVIDVWSRKVVAWDVAERDDAQIAADLVSRACLRERINRGRRQRLILHARNDNPYSESLFRTVKFRPDYPRRLFRSVVEACSWACALVNWDYHQQRHRAIRIVTPDQRHSGQAIAICRQRASV
jgi:transposase InsO family protein